MEILHALLQAVLTAFSMFWEILWPLILGFALSGIVQAAVSHQSMAKTLGCDGPKCLTFATLFGIASSSCSYAAVALARSIFQKGASFASAMAFELASTNLVIELGIILVVLMGWQFAAAEFVGGNVLRDDGCSRIPGRISFRGAWHYSAEPCDRDHHGGDSVELHEYPEYHLSRAGSTAGDAIYPNRGITHAQDDGYT